jgi:hypothetical protein
MSFVLHALKDFFRLLLTFQSLTMRVPDEGYSRHASCALNLISTFLLHNVQCYILSPVNLSTFITQLNASVKRRQST